MSRIGPPSPQNFVSSLGASLHYWTSNQYCGQNTLHCDIQNLPQLRQNFWSGAAGAFFEILRLAPPWPRITLTEPMKYALRVILNMIFEVLEVPCAPGCAQTWNLKPIKKIELHHFSHPLSATVNLSKDLPSASPGAQTCTNFFFSICSNFLGMR